MKLTRMLFSSETLDRGTVRHFSDGDFAFPLNSRGHLSYVDSVRLRRPVSRSLKINTGEAPGYGTLETSRTKRGFWSFLR